jgi:hypothetical protein
VKKIMFLLLLLTGLTGCDLEASLTAITQEKGEVFLIAMEPQFETAEDFHLIMSALSWGRPISYNFGEIIAEYKFGEETIGIIEISNGEMIAGAELEFANRLLLNRVEKNKLMTFIPFPEIADSVLVTMRLKCWRQWIEKKITITKPNYETLRVQIKADGLTSSGLLSRPSASSLTLRCRVSGGVKPYNFSWKNYAEEVIGNESTLYIPNIDCTKEGIYTVTVTDANGKSAVI